MCNCAEWLSPSHSLGSLMQGFTSPYPPEIPKVLSTSQTYQTHNRYFPLKQKEMEWNFAQQWEYTHLLPRSRVLPFLLRRLGVRRFARQKPVRPTWRKKGCWDRIWSEKKGQTDKQTTQNRTTITFLFANIWHRFWRKIKLEVRNTASKRVPGWSNWLVHKQTQIERRKM